MKAIREAPQQNGFTLWELMVSVLVAGIVLGFGVPSFMEFQRNNSMTGAANELVTGILLARAEAVKRQVPVTLCASPDPVDADPSCGVSGANGGFIVFVDENDNGLLTDSTDGNAAVDTDEEILLQRAAPGGTINVWSDEGHISYAPNGFKTDDSAAWVVFCDDRGNRSAAGGFSSARAIRIDPTGRGQVYQAVADVASAVTAIGDADATAACS